MQKVVAATLLAVQHERLEVSTKQVTDDAIRDLFKMHALEVLNDENQKKQPMSSLGSGISDISVRLETTIVSPSTEKLFQIWQWSI